MPSSPENPLATAHPAPQFCSVQALDLRRSPLPVPARFHNVPFDFDRYPGSGAQGVEGGANCQQYAYEFLRHHGFRIGDLRSSNLWEDTHDTVQVNEPACFDIAMVHDAPQAWGSHVLVCVGTNLFLHLSRRIGWPAVETLHEVMARPYYRYLIGFKRCRVRAPASTPGMAATNQAAGEESRVAGTATAHSIDQRQKVER